MFFLLVPPGKVAESCLDADGNEIDDDASTLISRSTGKGDQDGILE